VTGDLPERTHRPALVGRQENGCFNKMLPPAGPIPLCPIREPRRLDRSLRGFNQAKVIVSGRQPTLWWVLMVAEGPLLNGDLTSNHVRWVERPFVRDKNKPEISPFAFISPAPAASQPFLYLTDI